MIIIFNDDTCSLVTSSPLERGLRGVSCPTLIIFKMWCLNSYPTMALMNAWITHWQNRTDLALRLARLRGVWYKRYHQCIFKRKRHWSHTQRIHDATPIIEYTKEVIYLEEGEIARLSLNDGIELKTIENIEKTPFIHELEMNLESIEKGGYEHFMLKEIFEQPKSISDSIKPISIYVE